VAYAIGFAVVIAAIIGIVKLISGDRYSKMTEEEFEAKAKRGSRIGGALLAVQKLANPSLKVEYLRQQDKQVEGERVDAGDGGTPDSSREGTEGTPQK
jgi:hypothetical protein